jgi:hypothetical protein
VTAPRAVPTAVRVAAGLLALEGAALVVLGLVYGALSAAGEPESLAGAELAAGFAVVAGLLLLVVARAVSRLRGWSRSPALVTQVLMLPVGYGLAQGRVWAAAVPVLGLAVAVLYAFATAPAREAFRDAG